MVEAGIVVIRALPAGRDEDKHVASPPPLAEPQMSRAAGERVVPVMTAQSQEEEEEMLLTEINHKHQCIKNRRYTNTKLDCLPSSLCFKVVCLLR